MCAYRPDTSTRPSDQLGEINRRVMIFSEAAGLDLDWTRRCVHVRAVTGLLWDLSRGDVPRTRNYDFRLAISEGRLR